MASSDFHVGDLQGQIEEINEQIATKDISNDFTKASGIESLQAYRTGNVVQITIATSQVSGTNFNFGYIPSKYEIKGTMRLTAPIVDVATGKAKGTMYILASTGQMTAYMNDSVSNLYLFTSFTYVM